MANDTASTAQSIRRKLGRGLGSLISAPVRIDVREHGPTHAVSAPAAAAIQPAGAVPATAPAERDRLDDRVVQMLPLGEIHPSPRQPRQLFDESALQALASSILTSGVMQPIIVRSTAGTRGSPGPYELVAGERRWRAAQIAGLERIPAIVRTLDDRTAAEFSLIENLQREDLNPMERAEAFQRLIDEFGLTHNQVAQRVGLDRSSVTNHLRLNELDAETKAAVRGGGLSLGHAKALLALTNPQARSAIAAQALRQEWSVRELERRVKHLIEGAPAPQAKSTNVPTRASANMLDLERRLSEHLGTKVQLHTGRVKGSGKIVIEFYSIDQFEGLLRRIDFDPD